MAKADEEEDDDDEDDEEDGLFDAGRWLNSCKIVFEVLPGIA